MDRPLVERCIEILSIENWKGALRMNTGYVTLCSRILEKCQRQQWYAGDLHNTTRFREAGRRFEEYYNADGYEVVIDNDPDDHPRKTSFAYAPATEEQLHATEQALGFSLPPLLRTLYAQLANGGFGAGYGIIGALGGFCEAGDLVDNYLFHTKRARHIELRDDEQPMQPGERLELPETVWPRYLLYLCDWDWAAASCIDCQTGQVFLVHPSEENLYYVIEPQARSLEEWLELWLQGELKYEREEPEFEDDELDASHIVQMFEARSDVSPESQP
jgi:SMI1 / KNR4 family (SUKH-1)